MGSFSPKLPIWYQLSTMLRGDILSGRLSPGARIAPEVELAAQHGVSVVPVRQALRALEDDGLIVRQRGRGTFVSDTVRRARDSATSLEALYSREFTRPAEVLERGIGPVPPALAPHFGQGDTRLTYFRRLAFRDGVPWSYGTLYFLPEFDRQLTDARLRRHPLYRVMQERCGVQLVRTHFDAQAIAADPATARHLAVDPLSPVLALCAVTFDAADRPIGGFEMMFRSAPFTFSFDTAHPNAA